jgi:hypothetical protein
MGKVGAGTGETWKIIFYISQLVITMDNTLLEQILAKITTLEVQNQQLMERISPYEYKISSPKKEEDDINPPKQTKYGSPTKSYFDSAKRNSNPPLFNSRIILTTYPGGVGINPIPLKWGAMDPYERGPIVASRNSNSLKLRNAIGAHGGLTL